MNDDLRNSRKSTDAIPKGPWLGDAIRIEREEVDAEIERLKRELGDAQLAAANAVLAKVTPTMTAEERHATAPSNAEKGAIYFGTRFGTYVGRYTSYPLIVPNGQPHPCIALPMTADEQLSPRDHIDFLKRQNAELSKGTESLMREIAEGKKREERLRAALDSMFQLHHRDINVRDEGRPTSVEWQVAYQDAGEVLGYFVGPCSSLSGGTDEAK